METDAKTTQEDPRSATKLARNAMETEAKT